MMDEPLRQAILNQRGPCPPSEDLVAYEEGRLPEDSRRRLDQHLFLCPECSYLLIRLKKATEFRIEHDLLETDPATPSTRAPAAPLRLRSTNPWPLFPLAATFILGVFLTVGFVLLVPGLQATIPPTSPPVIRLAGPVRSGPLQPAVAPDFDAVPLLGLSFFVAVPDSVEVSCTLSDSQGRQLFRTERVRSFDGIGNFLILVPTGALEQNREYQLVARWQNLAGSRQEQAYSFVTAPSNSTHELD